jgi:glycosyltransferase involved in cell wall biosynthesis
VTVLPGAYPKFARAVVRELEHHAEVDVLDLAETDRRYGNTAVDPESVRERVARATGVPPVLDAATAAAFDADVLFVDWADKGLTLATERVPDHTRVVVRLHGVDTLSAWLHTARWERVDDAIFPSEHLRLATERALGGRLDGVRQHVVANPVDAGRYALPKVPGAEHTLGMVGWAQQVKDPGWTLDLLERLRAEDERWRLLLVGADFPLRSANTVESRAAQHFRARLLEGGSGLVDAVDFVGYSTRLPEVLRRVGWGVSSSRREGFHIGLVEMAASAAVPVVRDWPVYAEIGGARRLFPDDWVAHDVDAAAERVLALSSRGDWPVQGERAARVVAERFAGETAGDQLRRIVLG